MLQVSPQDEAFLLDTPTQQSVILPGAGNTILLIGADINRMVLLLGVIKGGPITFSMVPIVGAIGAFSLQVGGGDAVVSLTYADHGPVVQQQWFVASAVAGDVAGAIAMSMMRHPEMAGYTDVFHRPKVQDFPRPHVQRPRVHRPPPGRIPPAVLAKLGSMCPRILGGQS